MPDQGPPIEQLTRRLAETPQDFLSRSLLDPGPEVMLTAVVSDLLEDLGGEPLDSKELQPFRSRASGDLNRLGLVLVTCWLLHDSWFRDRGRFAGAARNLLSSGLAELAKLVPPDKFVSDPDRREELARLCLDALGLVPEGESQVVARDRLTTLSTVERQEVLSRMADAQRIRKIQEAMKQKAAQEAAPAWGHE